MQTRLMFSVLIFGALLVSASFPAVSADEQEQGAFDYWVEVKLERWVADQDVQWDNDESGPDPKFEMCIIIDGVEEDCVDSQKWTDTWELEFAWNVTYNLPENSTFLRLVIECKDRDAINHDECDMNPLNGMWRGDYEVNWTNLPLSENHYFQTHANANESDAQRKSWGNWSLIIHPSGDDDNDGVFNNDDLCPGTPPSEPAVRDGCPDGLHPEDDPDGDGLTNVYEREVSFTNPNASDSDNDGLNDGQEVNVYGTDPNDSDTDDDALSDHAEKILGTNATNRDSDGDGLSDGSEVNQYDTNPLSNDSDGDGIDDGEEVTNGTNPRSDLPPIGEEGSTDGANESSVDGFLASLCWGVCCIGIVLELLGIGIFKKKPKQKMVYVQPQQAYVTQQHQIRATHVAKLEQERNMAMARLQEMERNQQSSQHSGETEQLRSQIALMQENLNRLAQEKSMLRQEINEVRQSASTSSSNEVSQPQNIVQNITYNIQDSSIVADEFGRIGNGAEDGVEDKN